jgi:hypothetical protein
MNRASESDRQKTLRRHHEENQWVYWSLMILGVWLLAGPRTLGYDTGLVEPAGGRAVWLTLETRVLVMTWSDILSGLLLILLGFRALKPDRPITLWLACLIGIWLHTAPLVFWAPSAAAYLNGTVVGTLVILLSVVIPGTPNMIVYRQPGAETPPGWSYNPSSWPQRSIMLALSFLGWMISRYLAAYQLGYIDRVWEPFFGEGTVRVLTSDLSESVPISDAGLGALAYTVEFLILWMGGRDRWRTMPSSVLFFGILVIPLGLAHIFLVISQPVVVGFWCSFCLLAALIMLPMIPLEADEVVAMGQFLRRSKRAGKSLWRVFWFGGTLNEGGADERSPGMTRLADHPGQVLSASTWGMSFPWTLLLTTLLGLWLMFVPSVLGTVGHVANAERLAGALIITFSVIAMGEVLRPSRFVNCLLALVVIGAPWALEGAVTAASVNDALVGLLVFGLSIPRGSVREKYGSWDALIF